MEVKINSRSKTVKVDLQGMDLNYELATIKDKTVKSGGAKL